MGVVLLVALTSPASPVSLVRVGAEAPALTIVGSIEGLVAGTPATLALTLSNRSDADVQVRALTTTVTGVTGCAVGALVVSPWAGRLVVPAHGSVTTGVGVRLAEGVRCTAATWRLRYTSS